jgi:tetratricopeptide (TPR) repeat protein
VFLQINAVSLITPRSLSGLKRLHEAVSSFQEAIRLQPNLAMAHNDLANALSEQGGKKGALPHWRKAIELDPEYADAHANLAHTLANGAIPTRTHNAKGGLHDGVPCTKWRK